MDPSTQVSKMIIGPGSAGSLGDFLNVKPKKGKEGAWLHGNASTKRKANSLFGCSTPGKKIRSKGKGRGLARGRGKGPIGVPGGQGRGPGYRVGPTGISAGIF